MLQVTCVGGPFEIGFQHGSQCKKQVLSNIEFTKKLSTDKSKRTWDEVEAIAARFSQVIEQKWPRYREELRGVAEGSNCDLLDIVALNVRTEIAFGLAVDERDGCTNAWAMMPGGSLQGQNWDWMLPQKDNLVVLTIRQENYPTFKMVTEAGMIGKIGLNEEGVGVTYNALYLKGTNLTGLPSYLAMRIALESRSTADACSTVRSQGGMAASAYILVGDATTARGIEFCTSDISLEPPNQDGYVVHTNHCTLAHDVPDSDKGHPPPDSVSRLARIKELLGNCCRDHESFSNIWKDEDGLPTSICRKYKEGQSLGETLFSIVIDHQRKSAVVKLGRPTEPDEILELRFD